MKRSRLTVLVILIVSLAGVTSARRQQTPPAAAVPPAPTLPIGSLKAIMEAITVPASDAIFAAAAEAPRSDAEWTAVEHQALALAESANLLLLPGRAPDRGAWTGLSIAQRDAAVVAMTAARAKDADALSTAADTLYDTCDGCHKQYLPR